MSSDEHVPHIEGLIPPNPDTSAEIAALTSERQVILDNVMNVVLAPSVEWTKTTMKRRLDDIEERLRELGVTLEENG